MSQDQPQGQPDQRAAQEARAFEQGILAFYNSRRTLHRETDRGCALMAAAFLDDKVATLLKAGMLEKRRILNRLFGPLGPFGSFSSRIDAAYVLGIISLGDRTNLHNIRDVRNKFAHTAALMDFSDPEVAPLCERLTLHTQPSGTMPRRLFEQTAAGLCARLDTAILRATRPSERRDAALSADFVASQRQFDKVLGERIDQWRREGVTEEQVRDRLDQIVRNKVKEVTSRLAPKPP